MRSRPEISLPKTVKSGAVSRMIHAIDSSSTMRITIAASRPVRRACGLLRRRQLARQNRDEDDVVDAENDFEKRQRDQREQTVGGQKRIHPFTL